MSDTKYDEKSIGGLIAKGSKILTDAGIENAKAEARLFMVEYTHKDLSCLYARLTEKLDDFTAMRYMRSIRKRATHYPLQYILGYTYFLDYKIKCREKVLIPRYDTENLVLHALEMSPDKPIKVLDLCTGSGVIGITYKLWRIKEGYEDDKVILSDISDDAISLAEENASELGADVTVTKSDLFEVFEEVGEEGEIIKADKFDMILSNPPYIRTKEINNLVRDVRDFEPRLALDGSMDGLEFYKRIIDKAPEHLNENGVLIFEIGSNQYMSVSTMMKNAGFKHIRKLRDMSGLDRVVSGIL